MIAIRVDGPKAWKEQLAICFVISDEGKTHVGELRNGAFIHRAVDTAPSGVTTITLARASLIGVVSGKVDISEATAAGTISVKGNPGDLQRLLDLLGSVDPNFAIVTP